MTTATERTRGPGDLLADRYRLDDLLQESRGGRYWLAYDLVLSRAVAVHVIDGSDPRAPGLLDAARRSAVLLDRRILRVLDADARDGVCFVVTEWAEGTSLDVLLNEGPLAPERAAWLCAEVGSALASAHEVGHVHGRLLPEGVLIDRSGTVRIMGFAVDAALVGFSEGTVSGDVTDLAAILYTALTGRWPGTTPSERVAAAPAEGGQVLRARQVRAGVPAALDSLCDQVLGSEAARGGHARTPHDLTSAAGITTALQDYIGDPAPIAQDEAVAALTRLTTAAAISLPPEVPRARPPSEVDQSNPLQSGPLQSGPLQSGPRILGTPDPGDTAERPAVAAATSDLPAGLSQATQAPVVPLPAAPIDPDQTQAGVPIFHEDSAGGTEVSWFSPRPGTPPPPPPFEAAEPKPLFAPDTTPGSHRRVVNETPAAAAVEFSTGAPATGGLASDSAGNHAGPSGSEFWPWARPHPTRAPLPTPEVSPEPVPGRGWLRTAGIIAATLLLVLAIVAAYNMGRGRAPLGGDPGTPADAPSAPVAVSGEPLSISSVRDFDPDANPPQERPELVPLAYDGDPATAWRTEVYQQNFGPSGLKRGLGLVIDLGQTRDVTSVTLEFNGEGTSLGLDVSAESPREAADVTPVADFASATETLRASLAAPVSGRYVTVWLTSLPAVKGGFRAEIAEVVVRG